MVIKSTKDSMMSSFIVNVLFKLLVKIEAAVSVLNSIFSLIFSSINGAIVIPSIGSSYKGVLITELISSFTFTKFKL